MKKSLVSDAKTVFNALNGICCVYKPAGETLNRVRSSFLYKLSSGFTNGLHGVQIGRAYSNESSQDVHVEKSETILRVFSSKRNTFAEWHRFKPSKITGYKYEKWLVKTKREIDCYNQRFLEERHSVLGNDLATAHFIVFRGGKVKFYGKDEWISKDKDEEKCDKFPNKFFEGWDIEGVDASTLPLRYEGLKNLEGLSGLKWLSFKGCPYIDDWCVDKISGEYQDTLEYLDLSDCPSLSKNVLSPLYRLKHLKTLKLYNVASSNTFQFSALLLEDILPNLTIEGVNYIEIKE